uniref:Uncharacterized protein n=1 Tax=Acrobeloides nanus TaxID=290746 RepID=A0A914CT18_9BILA
MLPERHNFTEAHIPNEHVRVEKHVKDAIQSEVERVSKIEYIRHNLPFVSRYEATRVMNEHPTSLESEEMTEANNEELIWEENPFV